LPDGRTQVLVGTFDSSTPYFRITVRDTGCGIDFPVMEKMFEPFFTTKDVGRGTGLGLSAVHGIIADHKGAMLVTSKVGEGTAFELFFPLANAPQTATEVKNTALPKGAERVLVVDDEPQIARMTTKFLERLGYKAAAYHSPLEALAEFERASETWDLVITDQTMPHMTGTELAQKLLALKARLPIILCSGFSEGLKETAVKELGLFSFLPKPVDQAELARMIRSALLGGKPPRLLPERAQLLDDVRRVEARVVHRDMGLAKPCEVVGRVVGDVLVEMLDLERVARRHAANDAALDRVDRLRNPPRLGAASA
jgi:CheY-like chemotaxis protein